VRFIEDFEALGVFETNSVSFSNGILLVEEVSLG
jgi:hypothetical protein